MTDEPIQGPPEEEKVEVEEELSEEERLVKKCAEMESSWKRALADYDNLQKDLSKQKQDMRLATIRSVCSELLPVMDNFDQAVKFKPEGLDGTAENWLTGILHVRTQLESVLTNFGCEPFGAEGEMFDPHLHEAATERSEDDKPDQSVLEVAGRGWKMGDYIIRPAKVIINSIS